VATPIESAFLKMGSFDMLGALSRKLADRWLRIAPPCGLIWQYSTMDSIDRAIIDELRRDGRLSNVELAARVNLSPSPCLRRVRALEESGVIRGYHADIEPSAIGRGLEVSVLVELSLKDRKTVEAFEEQISAIDEVLECRRMFGIPDYIIRVGVADTDDYERFYMTELAELPGVTRVNSQFTMKLVKAGTPGSQTGKTPARRRAR
jgi:Lrp/AsnC family transcriptional regulator, leucine-responsive regulatory protein